MDLRHPSAGKPHQHLDLPIPAEADYAKKGGHFGPHNLHENRPGSFVSETLIFATWQNAASAPSTFPIPIIRSKPARSFRPTL